ncbi:uncharacterized protein EKO05_0004684 [Ascochyta rabiei]|uniref:Uncharacterized protein n=1 Tax=Didymella rabiei TaxID=5454 RepID=A0A163KP84_DIDRA|nr:uncharacterized protein EKO05_0004684 [Ascochyta rabiei]KZM27144.1 hypothetical protein ST47_g1686 [Ascochyta rabiei]UPX14194.1 hypothetical protein EKO05_0004684 [Ascochyta rabiei]
MSHSATDSSQHSGNQTTWMQIPRDDPSNPSEAPTRVAYHTHDNASPQDAEEYNGLLNANVIASHRRSVSTTSSQVSGSQVPKAKFSVAAGPSETSSQPNLEDIRSHANPCTANIDEDRTYKPSNWLPYTLRRTYLVLLAFCAFVCAIVLAVLCAYSTHHYGLTTNNGSLGQFIARRYVPTVLAVLFTLAVTMIAEDVKRTEPFARMASPQPVTANHTLFYVPKVWWKSVFTGLSLKRSGGHRRWILSLSSLAAGISVLVISTFSSTVFTTRDVVLRTDTQLQRYTPQQNGSIFLLPRRDTYTRAMSGFLYNASTSLWVTDSHVVLPFTTPDTNPPVLNEGTWRAKTKVSKLDSTCVSMTLSEKTDINITYTSVSTSGCNGTCSKQSRGLKLRSEDGCEVQLQTPIAHSVDILGGYVISNPVGGYYTDALSLQGGMIWTNLSSAYVSWESLIREHGSEPPLDSDEIVLDQWRRTFIYKFSDQCKDRDLLFVSPAWFAERIMGKPSSWQEDYWENFTARAELCAPRYSAADISVTAVIGGAAPGVFFDNKEFEQSAKPVSHRLLDVARLNDLAFGEAWLKYFPAPAGDEDVEGFEGVSMLLAKTFSLKIANLLANRTLSSEGSRLRSRFFGELISSSVLEADTKASEDVDGEYLKSENRIIVVPGVAIALAVLLSLAGCYSLFMVWFASSHRRPLNLKSDPAMLVGVVPLTSITSPLAADLRTWKNHDRTEIQSKIGSQKFSLHSGIISRASSKCDDAVIETGAPKAERLSWMQKRIPRQPPKPEWRPAMLHKTWLSILLLALIGVAIAMLVLRKFADEEVLFQTVFVQQIDLSLFHASLSPHSIIATLVAVIIGLCWDSIDKAMRTLQPYLSMSREPSGPSHGISITYESSYWIWAAIKSARSRHWILLLVTLGTTLSQIFIISVAAVFERRTVIHTQATQDMDIEVLHLLTTRQKPFEFGIGLGQRPFYLSDALLGTSNTDWLYSALDEITLNTHMLPWTGDEWIFTPVNLTGWDDRSESYVATQSQSGSRNEAASFTSSFNVSLTTSALRSRLECEVVTVSSSGWLDDVQSVYPNRFDKSATGYVLPMTVSPGGDFAAPIFSAPRRLACCTNGTDKGKQSVVAYWSSNSSLYDQQPAISVDPDEAEDTRVSSGWTKDFAIKWIVGSAASTIVPGTESNFLSNSIGTANETVLYFPEEPQTSIMRCTPIIEQTNASITFARDTKQVLKYKLLDEPQPAIGAWDYAYDVVYEVPGSNSSRGNVSYGVFFVSQLLSAPHIVEPQMRSSMMVANHTIENLDAERFALRDSDKGTNMDYMSYANFVLANKDPTALLNTTLLQQHSEKTFQTFFKHFVATANWTYGGKFSVSRAAYEELWSYQRQAEKFDGIVTERIEVLSMNKVATWLSLVILFLLMIILVILIVTLQVVYPRTSMLRRVECLADVLAMVAGSDELNKLIGEVGVEGMEKVGIKTRLGWFRDKRGTVRWGVEIVGGNVQWLDGPKKIEGKKTSESAE